MIADGQFEKMILLRKLMGPICIHFILLNFHVTIILLSTKISKNCIFRPIGERLLRFSGQKGGQWN